MIFRFSFFPTFSFSFLLLVCCSNNLHHYALDPKDSANRAKRNLWCEFSSGVGITMTTVYDTFECTIMYD